MARCRSCGAEIVWAETSGGRYMPLDPEPRQDGNMIIENGRAIAAGPLDQGERFVAHFVSCPDAAAWRKKEGRP